MKVLKDQNKEYEPKKKREYIPKIVVCPDYKSLEMVRLEFISLLSGDAVGICLITLQEAIKFKLPLIKAMKDFSNKIPHDIYIANTVDEKIPSDYQDQKEIIDLDSVVDYFRKNPRIQERNKPCLCESGKKYKNCCLLSENKITN